MRPHQRRLAQDGVGARHKQVRARRARVGVAVAGGPLALGFSRPDGLDCMSIQEDGNDKLLNDLISKEVGAGTI